MIMIILWLDNKSFHKKMQYVSHHLPPLSFDSVNILFIVSLYFASHLPPNPLESLGDFGAP